VEVGALPRRAPVPRPGGRLLRRRRHGGVRASGRRRAFLKLEALGEPTLNPKLLEDPSVTALSADVTEEFSRFLEKEYPDLWRKFFQKAPDMLGITVEIVIQVLRSDDVKDAGGMRDKLKQAALFFKGDRENLLALLGDNQFRSMVKLTGQPVLHDVVKNGAVGAFVGCGIEAGLNR
jgi:hypothetical protein